MEWEKRYSTECATDPIYSDGKMFITTYDGGCVLIDVRENIPKIVWKNTNMSSEICSSVLVDGYLYGVDGKTDRADRSVRCIEWETGSLMWEKKIIRMATLSAAGGKLIILDEDGTLHIAEATPSTYKELSVGHISDGERLRGKCWTPPVLYKGRLYYKSNLGDLICIDVSK